MILADLLQIVNANDGEKKLIVKNDYVWHEIKNVIITNDTIQLIMNDTHVFGNDDWKGDETKKWKYMLIL